MPVRRFIHSLALALAASCIACAPATAAPSGASALRATYEKLAPELNKGEFGRPMVLKSAETESALKGEVYGVLDYPLAKVGTALDKPTRWCEMLMLHLNNRGCRADDGKKR